MLTFLGRGSAFADEHNSAFFIHDGNLILIDCPMSSFEKLNDMNLTLFDHIYLLVTHTHGDHVSGIGMLVDLLQFSVRTPITVVAPSKEVEGDLFYLLSRIEGCNESWYELINTEELDTDWFVCSIQTSHTEELAGKCFGYCLTATEWFIPAIQIRSYHTRNISLTALIFTRKYLLINHPSIYTALISTIRSRLTSSVAFMSISCTWMMRRGSEKC